MLLLNFCMTFRSSICTVPFRHEKWIFFKRIKMHILHYRMENFNEVPLSSAHPAFRVTTHTTGQ